MGTYQTERGTGQLGAAHRRLRLDVTAHSNRTNDQTAGGFQGRVERWLHGQSRGDGLASLAALMLPEQTRQRYPK